MKKELGYAVHRGIIYIHIGALLIFIFRFMGTRAELQLAIIARNKCYRETKFTGDALSFVIMIYATNVSILLKSEL
jgi:hypothetical protein